MKKIIKLSAIFILCITTCSCMVFSIASPIVGTVIDEATGKPVANAVVVATWYSESPGYHSPGRKVFEVQEAVVDVQGRFKIPGWNFKTLNRAWATIDTSEPELFIFKYGYLPREIGSYGRSGIKKLNGEAEIKVTLLTGTASEKNEKLSNSHLYTPSIHQGCEWKKRINILLEVDKQLEDTERYFANKNKINKGVPHIPASMYTPWYLSDELKKPDCPGAIELLKNARKSRNKE